MSGGCDGSEERVVDEEEVAKDVEEVTNDGEGVVNDGPDLQVMPWESSRMRAGMPTTL